MDYKKAYENDTIQTKKGVIIHNGIKTLEQKVKTVKKKATKKKTISKPKKINSKEKK